MHQDHTGRCSSQDQKVPARLRPGSHLGGSPCCSWSPAQGGGRGAGRSEGRPRNTAFDHVTRQVVCGPGAQHHLGTCGNPGARPPPHPTPDNDRLNQTPRGAAQRPGSQQVMLTPAHDGPAPIRLWTEVEPVIDWVESTRICLPETR